MLGDDFMTLLLNYGTPLGYKLSCIKCQHIH